jgi:hypothetical protein
MVLLIKHTRKLKIYILWNLYSLKLEEIFYVVSSEILKFKLAFLKLTQFFSSNPNPIKINLKLSLWTLEPDPFLKSIKQKEEKECMRGEERHLVESAREGPRDRPWTSEQQPRSPPGRGTAGCPYPTQNRVKSSVGDPAPDPLVWGTDPDPTLAS